LGKRRVLSEGDINQLVLPGMGQLLGIVTQMFGYDRIMVKCSDGDRPSLPHTRQDEEAGLDQGWRCGLGCPLGFPNQSRRRALALHTESSAGTSQQGHSYDVTPTVQACVANREAIECPSRISIHGKDQRSRSPAQY